MSIDSIISVQITETSANVSQAGFGVPLIFGCSASFPERVREYTSSSEVSSDFAASTPEYKMAAKIFAQNPRPEKVMIGRRLYKPTQTYTVTCVAEYNSTVYSLTFGGETFSYTSDTSASAAEILGALETWAEHSDRTFDVGVSVSGSVATITADTAGAWYACESADQKLFQIDQTTPAVNGFGGATGTGVVDDLNGMLLENDGWYLVLNPHTSKAEASAIAGWVAANSRIHIAGSADSSIYTTSTSDIASTLKAAGSRNTAVICHTDSGAFVDAAWGGKCLPFEPGSETWDHKQLLEVAVPRLTPDQLAKAKAKNATTYERVKGLNVTQGGKTAKPEWIDIVRGLHWLSSRMQERIFGKMASLKKIPYTDKGTQIVAGEVRSQLNEGIENQLISENPAPVVTVPLVSTVSTADKQNRHLPRIKFRCTLAGAISSGDVEGEVSY